VPQMRRPTHLVRGRCDCASFPRPDQSSRTHALANRGADASPCDPCAHASADGASDACSDQLANRGSDLPASAHGRAGRLLLLLRPQRGGHVRHVHGAPGQRHVVRQVQGQVPQMQRPSHLVRGRCDCASFPRPDQSSHRHALSSPDGLANRGADAGTCDPCAHASADGASHACSGSDLPADTGNLLRVGDRHLDHWLLGLLQAELLLERQGQHLCPSALLQGRWVPRVTQRGIHLHWRHRWHVRRPAALRHQLSAQHGLRRRVCQWPAWPAR